MDGQYCYTNSKSIKIYLHLRGIIYIPFGKQPCTLLDLGISFMNDMKFLKTGELAARMGINRETIRFYERKQLLEAPRRDENGYRLYPIEAVDRLSFIQKAKEAGFTLDEIKELLGMRIAGAGSCGPVRKKALARLNAIEDKILTLKKMKKSLMKLVQACQKGSSIGDCPILESFSRPD